LFRTSDVIHSQCLQFTRAVGLLSKAECAALLASPELVKPLPGSAAGGL
jgi:hypothetical protein